MALAPIQEYDARRVLGSFVERDHGCTFEYSKAEGYLPFGDEYASTIWMSDGTRRWAKVLATVAHVVVDEDDDGPVVEKWRIRRHMRYDMVHAA